MSMLLVCTLMPAFLVLFDHILMKNEWDRIRLFLKQRRQKKLEHLKELAQKAHGTEKRKKEAQDHAAEE